jgi:serine/threonine-protein kinase
MDIGLSWILMDILTNCDAELLRPLPYLLPEIAKGDLLTLSSDLYCLGFMMYDMLTKRVPYSGLPKTSIMGKLAFDQADPVFDFPDHVPEAICELIRQMTRNHSSQRLQDATHVLTILNQQLAKYAPGLSIPPTAPAEPQSMPESPRAKLEAPIPPPQTPVSAPPLNQPPVVNRAKHSDYRETQPENTRKRLGLTLGIIFLLIIGIGGTMGYVYREQLDIHFLSTSQELIVPNQPLITEPAPPTVLAPPSDSFTTLPPENFISPPPDISTAEEPRVKPNDTPNSDTSNRAIPTPTPSPTMETEGSHLKPDALQNMGTTVQERTRAQSPVSTPQPILETKPVPEQPNPAPPQDHTSIVNQPFPKKPATPVTAPAPKPPAIVSETGQASVPTVTKEPASHSELPSELSPNRPQTLQDSTSPSPNIESLDNSESKKLKEILDSVQIPETVTTLPKHGPGPLLPSPSAPPSPTTLSSTESFP